MSPAIETPRLVIAGAASNVGKTTVTVALLGALRKRGLKVAAFKCGPDYLDPTYHARIVGRSHNLDGWMMGREAVTETFARVAADADIAIIEGVMGLFDGASPTSLVGSTAEIANWLGAPVILVMDASGMAGSAAALLHGFASFRTEVRVAGAIANRVGSRSHLELLRAACAHVAPVMGGFPVRRELAFPERHLGLVTAAGKAVSEATLEQWFQAAEEWLDLDGLLELARTAPAVEVPDDPHARPDSIATPRVRLGIAVDEAFNFYYEDNLRRLEQEGAQLVRFSPLVETRLPALDGLYFGGGYPELYAEQLAKNAPMLSAVREMAGAGAPIYAECGGLMYLAQGIRTLEGRRFPMVGLIPAEITMTERLQALGYAEVEIGRETFLGPAETRFRGHQFRYSHLELTRPDAVELVYRVKTRRNREPFAEGYMCNNVLGSYVHGHWASNPSIPARFVAAMAAFRQRQRLSR